MINIIQIVVLLAAIPVGYLIAYMARDELVIGRKWFIAIITLSFLLSIWFYFKEAVYLTLTCAFISIVSFISVIKSYDKRWTKKQSD